ncbi:MAG TPA: hypothetical protein VFP50_14960 [Anaeromyxobacteraceae bacterium]|nr:hypothetical protein [Anaeromyxobacteraceae bacterium]
MSPAKLVAAALALAGTLLLPVPAAALEQRFDHREQQGPLLGFSYDRDTVAISGRTTRNLDRPALRLGWGFDPTGEGNEIIVGAIARLGGYDDPTRERYLAGVDARYRGYFGTEELKTFFEVGLWSELRSRFAIGPLVGLGVAWDFSREFGVYASVQFSTGLGEERIASVGGTTGIQVRWE